MSRRIVSLFAVVACAAVVAPAGADPECYDGVCRMPEVMAAPDPSAAQASAAPPEEIRPAMPAPQQVTVQQPAPQQLAPQQAASQQTASQQTAPQPVSKPIVVPTSPSQPHPAVAERLGAAPEPIRPQMRVDEAPRPGPRPELGRAVERFAEKPVVRQARRALAPPPAPVEEPIEVSRGYSVAEAPQGYAPYHPVPPSAGIVVVAPGAQYGEDGIAVANAPQDSSWRLCQTDRPGYPHNRCIQYNYQPYGVYGYRPLGTYRTYKASPSYVYVPDAKVISLD